MPASSSATTASQFGFLSLLRSSSFRARPQIAALPVVVVFGCITPNLVRPLSQVGYSAVYRFAPRRDLSNDHPTPSIIVQCSACSEQFVTVYSLINQFVINLLPEGGCFLPIPIPETFLLCLALHSPPPTPAFLGPLSFSSTPWTRDIPPSLFWEQTLAISESHLCSPPISIICPPFVPAPLQLTLKCRIIPSHLAIRTPLWSNLISHDSPLVLCVFAFSSAKV